MLPIPFIDYIPQSFDRDNADLQAFASKMDEIFEELKADTLGLNTLIDPFRIPPALLDNLGYLLSAGINQQDDEHAKRIKIAEAVQGHKRRGSWNDDAKPKIDSIAGGDSQIIRSFDQDDFILVGDGLTPTAYYWAVMGCDGIDTDQGISLIGSGYEIEVAGNVFIDVDNNALTTDEQEEIELVMQDIVPAYYRVHFGYINGSGQFVEYFVME